MSNKNFFHMVGEDVSLEQIREEHIIPVYTRDNTPLISETAFIERTMDSLRKIGTIEPPVIRVSHPIKGRTYEARHKKVSELLPHEQTLYYERMGFAIKIPGFEQFVDGKETSLTVCGVKAYNLDTMNRQGSLQHFKLAVGRSVQVCLNLCISAKYGTVADIKVGDEDGLVEAINDAVNSYDAENHLSSLQHLTEGRITSKQFANILGRLRMLDALGGHEKLPKVIITDGQVKSVAKTFYTDEHFKGNGHISFWSLYNLFTESVKNTYLDSFIDRQNNAYELVEGLQASVEGRDSTYDWFLN